MFTFDTEINAISWSESDTQFLDTCPEEAVIAQVAQADTIQANTNFGSPPDIAQTLQPVLERFVPLPGDVVIDFVRICQYNCSL